MCIQNQNHFVDQQYLRISRKIGRGIFCKLYPIEVFTFFPSCFFVWSASKINIGTTFCYRSMWTVFALTILSKCSMAASGIYMPCRARSSLKSLILSRVSWLRRGSMSLHSFTDILPVVKSSIRNVFARSSSPPLALFVRLFNKSKLCLTRS